MKKSTIFWGVFLISLGILMLCYTLNTFAGRDFSFIIHLWPLFIIFWGVSLIKMPDIARKILSAINALFLALFIFAIISSGWHFSRNIIFNWRGHHITGNCSDSSYHGSSSYSIPMNESIKSGEIILDMAAGQYKVSDTTSNLFDYSGRGIRYKCDFSKDSSAKAIVHISSPADINFFDDNDNDDDGNRLNLKLNRNVIWDMNLNVGASDSKLDLKPFKIRNININCGASAFKLKMGDPVEDQKINIDAGASDIKLEIPFTTACRINSSTGLSGEHFNDFVDKGSYFETENFDAGTKKLFINISGGVSSFKVVRVKNN